jgi:hypothetical protein
MEPSFSQSLPTSHWAYKSIRKLQVSGYFKSLPKGILPYSRIEIAHDLNIILNDQENNISHQEIYLLRDEFKNELEIIKEEEKDRTEIISAESIHTFKSGISSNLLMALNGSACYSINPTLLLQYSIIIDQDFYSSPDYFGYKWRGFAGYQDQIFITFRHNQIQLLFGRDYLVWGYGHTGNLFISDNSRSLDMVKISSHSEHLIINFFVSQLDKMYGAERYLSATKIMFRPTSNITLGLGQSALYGGENRSIDFTLSNPLSFYSLTQDNDGKYMNGMLYFDFYGVINNSVNIYGELLIDDFQIDHSAISDLEPNEIAFIIGIEGINIFERIDYWFEFVQVRNRTYNVPDMRNFEKFLHRGKPIGHPLGTDFQMISTNFEGWISSTINAYGLLAFIRKGEGTIEGSFQEPWLNDGITLESGFTEKVPSGIVETTSQITAGIHWYPNGTISLHTSLGYEYIRNYDNISAMEFTGVLFDFQIESTFRGMKMFK